VRNLSHASEAALEAVVVTVNGEVATEAAVVTVVETVVIVVATGVAEAAVVATVVAGLRPLMAVITAQPPKNNSQQLRQMERRQARTYKVKCE
jgi:hypothetical protein